ERGLPDALEERRDRHAPMAAGAGDNGLGIEREKRWRHVGRRCRVAEIAAERGQVAHLHRAHERCALRERWIARADAGMDLELPRRYPRPDPEPAAVDLVHRPQLR